MAERKLTLAVSLVASKRFEDTCRSMVLAVVRLRFCIAAARPGLLVGAVQLVCEPSSHRSIGSTCLLIAFSVLPYFFVIAGCWDRFS
jgi:hypothetical protein